jgi:hypothetical protein
VLPQRIIGCLWRWCFTASGQGLLGEDLPERFGNPIKIQTRFFSLGNERRVEERILAADADHEYAMIDSTTVRAHQHGGLLTNPVCPEPRSCAAKDVALANCERLRFATAMLPG